MFIHETKSKLFHKLGWRSGRDRARVNRTLLAACCGLAGVQGSAPSLVPLSCTRSRLRASLGSVGAERVRNSAAAAASSYPFDGCQIRL